METVKQDLYQKKIDAICYAGLIKQKSQDIWVEIEEIYVLLAELENNPFLDEIDTSRILRLRAHLGEADKNIKLCHGIMYAAKKHIIRTIEGTKKE